MGKDGYNVIFETTEKTGTRGIRYNTPFESKEHFTKWWSENPGQEAYATVFREGVTEEEAREVCGRTRELAEQAFYKDMAIEIIGLIKETINKLEKKLITK